MAFSFELVRQAAAYWDTWLAFRQRFDRIPGVQAAVRFDGVLVRSTVHGHADLELGIPLTSSHLFRVASHSKTFTATAILQLAEAGCLRLDDTLADHLDWCGDSPLAARTIRELLAHGGGVIRDGSDGDFWQLYRPFPDEETLRSVALGASDVFEPNERFKYSNIAYSLLGLVVASASEMFYAEYVKRNILDRLGLADTGPEFNPERSGEYVTGYTPLSYLDSRRPIDHVATGALAPATGFYSTARDLVTYASAHTIGVDTLLADRSKRLAQRGEWEVEDTDERYGLGFAIKTVGDRRVIGHRGAFPGQSTATLLDPESGLAVSVLTNALDGPAETLATAFFKLVNTAAEKGGDTEPAPTDVLCGRYANLWHILDVVRLGDSLMGINPTLADPTEQTTELDVVDNTTLKVTKTNGYASPGELLSFDMEDGSVRHVRGMSGLSFYPIEVWKDLIETTDRVMANRGVRASDAGEAAHA